jgi:phospholipase C
MIPRIVAAALLAAAVVAAGSIKDIEHVVLFMQENRAFDHVRTRRHLYMPNKGVSYLARPLINILNPVFWIDGRCSRIPRSQRSDQPEQHEHLLPVRSPLSLLGQSTNLCRYVPSSLSTATDYLMPFYAGYLGGNATDALQCATGGDNAWAAMHEVYHGGLNDYWAANNTPWSLMYLKRDDLPVQFELAEGNTVGDMYQVRILSPGRPGSELTPCSKVSWP